MKEIIPMFDETILVVLPNLETMRDDTVKANKVKREYDTLYRKVIIITPNNIKEDSVTYMAKLRGEVINKVEFRTVLTVAKYNKLMSELYPTLDESNKKEIVNI